MSRRIPKRGFSKNRFNAYKHLSYASVSKILYCIDKGRIDPAKPIEMKNLKEAGVCSKIIHGVKLTGRGVEQLRARNLALNLVVSECTKSVAETVQQLGGSVTLQYNTRLTLRAHLQPEKFETLPRMPIPPPKRVLRLEKMRENLGICACE